ncbi:hypothetical protein [Parageobacillus thermoglucosidasius]|uniref:Uncharacterized protein n=1 Tax=Parageobacillus thermoglucosidasius TaxID=1426 RepID=A0AB38QXN2_PARTM|nr:hypothetical protein [Parageobacillus thermoglucosidasius]UOE75841.1 hypothetical protein IMI45_16340 [Parageobacillus thermoglucosidasius]
MFNFFKKKCNHTSYKLEVEIHADPIWCAKCGENLDIEDFPFSQELKEELFEWVSQYAKILEKSDYGTHIKKETRNAIKEHNNKGLILFNKVKQELGENSNIEYVPTTL